VQLLCVQKANLDPELAQEFMHILGVHPDDKPLDIPPGAPAPSPHLRLTSETQCTITHVNQMKGAR
jgi:hypothetical protein